MTTAPEELLSPIASPLASDKVEQMAFQLMGKYHSKKMLFRGVKEVKKSFKRQQKGILFLAADTFPSEIIAAFPTLANQEHIPYAFLKSRSEIAKASGLKESVIAVLIKEDTADAEYVKLYNKVKDMQIKHSGIKIVNE